MKITSNLFRRRYYDLRFSWGLIGPLLAMGNFVLIAYNFTALNMLAFEVFTIIFAIVIACAMSFLGLFLRKYQMPTDFKLQYERNVEQVRTQLVQLIGIRAIFTHLGSKFTDNYQEELRQVDERISYLRQVLKDQKYDFLK